MFSVGEEGEQIAPREALPCSRLHFWNKWCILNAKGEKGWLIAMETTERRWPGVALLIMALLVGIYAFCGDMILTLIQRLSRGGGMDLGRTLGQWARYYRITYGQAAYLPAVFLGLALLFGFLGRWGRAFLYFSTICLAVTVYHWVYGYALPVLLHGDGRPFEYLLLIYSRVLAPLFMLFYLLHAFRVTLRRGEGAGRLRYPKGIFVIVLILWILSLGLYGYTAVAIGSSATPSALRSGADLAALTCALFGVTLCFLGRSLPWIALTLGALPLLDPSNLELFMSTSRWAYLGSESMLMLVLLLCALLLFFGYIAGAVRAKGRRAPAVASPTAVASPVASTAQAAAPAVQPASAPLYTGAEAAQAEKAAAPAAPRGVAGRPLGNKSKVAAAILAGAIGPLGAHRFYLGYKGRGMFHAIAFTCFLVAYGLILGMAAANSSGSEVEVAIVAAALLLLFFMVTAIMAFVDFIRILTNKLLPADGTLYRELTGWAAPQQPTAAPAAAPAVSLAKAVSPAPKAYEGAFAQEGPAGEPPREEAPWSGEKDPDVEPDEDIYAALENLALERARGHITQEEYDAQKAELLEQLEGRSSY